MGLFLLPVAWCFMSKGSLVVPRNIKGWKIKNCIFLRGYIDWFVIGMTSCKFEMCCFKTTQALALFMTDVV